jgi:hypothetical protein
MASNIVIRVWEGSGKGGNQCIPFDAARGRIQREFTNITFEALSVDVMNHKLRLSPTEFIDWATGGNIFIARTHFHQGLSSLNWNIQELWEQYSRLREIIAFPAGKDDPIFLQDKFRYLSSLDSEDYLPTYKVDIPPLGEDDDENIVAAYEDQLIGLEDFLAEHKEETFVVKTPCTTHGSNYSKNIFCRDRREVYERMSYIIRLTQHAKIGNNHILSEIELPYLFVQVKAPCCREDKVLVLNGKAKMLVATDKRSQGRPFKSTIPQIFAFAEKVTQRLKQVIPETMTEFLIRVDLFEVDGKLKVNEFESFEALFTSKWVMSSKCKRNGANEVPYWDDYFSAAWCEEFWYQKLKDLIAIYLAGIEDVRPLKKGKVTSEQISRLDEASKN